MFKQILVFLDALFICWKALGVRKLTNVPVKVFGERTTVECFVWFAGFTLLTAPMFLYSASELKYICWIFIVSYLLFTKKYKFHGSVDEILLLIFIGIILLGIFIGGYWVRGSMMCMKYIILILFLIIGSNVNITYRNICFIFEYGMYGVILALIFASGMLQVTIPSVYWFTSGFFFGGAGISDCFSIFAPIALGMVKLTNNKKYYLIWSICILSDICFVVRTGIGGICVSSAVYWALQRETKKIFLLCLVVVTLALSFIYIPSIRDKMYSHEIQNRIESEGLGLYLLDRDNMMDSGRHSLIENLRAFLPHKGNNFWGYGSGATNTSLRYLNRLMGTAVIAHNDYKVIEIDNGIFGLVSWFIVLSVIIITHLRMYFSSMNIILTRELNAIAISSLAGAMFAMAFDNVLAHSMSSIGVSFLLLGLSYASFQNDIKQKLFI